MINNDIALSVPITYCIQLHHLLDRIIGNNRIRYDLLRSIGKRLNWPWSSPWSSDFDPPLPLCKIVMPLLPLWKHRQLPRCGSNLAPSTETLVIACCCRLNESLETAPYKTRTNLRSLSDSAQCRRPGWSRDTWGQGPYKQCHCDSTGTGRMYHRRSVLARDGIMIGCGSLLHENGDPRWETLSTICFVSKTFTHGRCMVDQKYIWRTKMDPNDVHS